MAVFQLFPKGEKTFRLMVKIPLKWSINKLFSQSNTAINFDIYPLNENYKQLLIHLPDGIASGSSQKLFFEAEFNPNGWYEQWSEKEINIPSLIIENSTITEGVISIFSDSEFYLKQC